MQAHIRAAIIRRAKRDALRPITRHYTVSPYKRRDHSDLWRTILDAEVRRIEQAKRKPG